MKRHKGNLFQFKLNYLCRHTEKRTGTSLDRYPRMLKKKHAIPNRKIIYPTRAKFGSYIYTDIKYASQLLVLNKHKRLFCKSLEDIK